MVTVAVVAFPTKSFIATKQKRRKFFLISLLYRDKHNFVEVYDFQCGMVVPLNKRVLIEGMFTPTEDERNAVIPFMG